MAYLEVFGYPARQLTHLAVHRCFIYENPNGRPVPNTRLQQIVRVSQAGPGADVLAYLANGAVRTLHAEDGVEVFIVSADYPGSGDSLPVSSAESLPLER